MGWGFEPGPPHSRAHALPLDRVASDQGVPLPLCLSPAGMFPDRWAGAARKRNVRASVKIGVLAPCLASYSQMFVSFFLSLFFLLPRDDD